VLRDDETMFEIAYRDQVRERVLRLAREDARAIAGAVVGSFALTDGDRWSDLDLTFSVPDDTDLTDVLDDWARALAVEFGSTVLFDLPAGASIYRVFLFPGALQVDLSVTPASQFGARGESFRLLFGKTNAQVPSRSRTPAEMFGMAVHHAVRARVSIERDRTVQAEYWISSLRDEVLALGCQRLGLAPWQARGAHLLPRDLTAILETCLVRSFERAELLRALAASVDALLAERSQDASLPAGLDRELLALSVP
jgi:hypothetical protein